MATLLLKSTYWRVCSSCEVLWSAPGGGERCWLCGVVGVLDPLGPCWRGAYFASRLPAYPPGYLILSSTDPQAA